MDDMMMKPMYDTEQATPCPYCGNTFLIWGDKPEWDVDDNYCFMHWTAVCSHCQRSFSVSEDYQCIERRIYYSKENKDEKDSD